MNPPKNTITHPSQTPKPQRVPDPWITVEHIIDELQVSRSTWNKWRAQPDRLAMIRLPNGALRCRRSTFAAWLETLEDAA